MEEIKEKINGILRNLNNEEGEDLLRHIGSYALLRELSRRANTFSITADRNQTLALSEIEKRFQVVIITFPFEEG